MSRSRAPRQGSPKPQPSVKIPMEDFEAIREGDLVTIGSGKATWTVERITMAARVHPGMPMVSLGAQQGSRRRRVACLVDLHKAVAP